MIRLVKCLPRLYAPRAELIKLNCISLVYPDSALFWVQNETQALIGMLDTDMIIYNIAADFKELKSFVNMISPRTVFSDSNTLTKLFGDSFERVCVMRCDSEFDCETPSDTLSSDRLYALLDVEGIELPPYEHFAPDFCRRLNHGWLKYFALPDAAAIAVTDTKYALLNGIASRKKGMGSIALHGVLSQLRLPSLAVCRENVTLFYLKNGFKNEYYAGYWRKKT